MLLKNHTAVMRQLMAAAKVRTSKLVELSVLEVFMVWRKLRLAG